VLRDVQRIAALAAQSAAAQTKLRKLETDKALANESLARVTQDLASSQALVAASAVAVRPVPVAPPDVADSPPPPAPHPGEEAQRLKTAVEELKKQLATRTKQAAALTKDLAIAKSACDEATAKLRAAESSLVKWQAAQQNAKSSTAAGKGPKLSRGTE
jgi:hypothetical protein